MSNNMLTVREGLTAEINALAAEVRDLNLQIDEIKGNIKSKMVQMGIKLIALRELAYEEYGERSGGRVGGDGRRCPNNWAAVCEQADITVKYASKCMQYARDPEGMTDRQRAHMRKSYTRDPLIKVLIYLRPRLPYMTCAEKQRCMETIYASIQKMREAA